MKSTLKQAKKEKIRSICSSCSFLCKRFVFTIHECNIFPPKKKIPLSCESRKKKKMSTMKMYSTTVCCSLCVSILLHLSVLPLLSLLNHNSLCRIVYAFTFVNMWERWKPQNIMVDILLCAQKWKKNHLTGLKGKASRLSESNVHVLCVAFTLCYFCHWCAFPHIYIYNFFSRGDFFSIHSPYYIEPCSCLDKIFCTLSKSVNVVSTFILPKVIRS